jgi:hypothetical protein
MKKYIGTKQIEAEPMTMGEAYRRGLLHAGRVPSESEKSKAGYYVKYDNGYESWSPADVFEKAYKVADTFLDRLRIERDELHDRYVKAKNYLSSPLAEKQLTPREKGSLAAQVEFMRQYLLCVEERIKYAMEKLNDKKDISE